MGVKFHPCQLLTVVHKTAVRLTVSKISVRELSIKKIQKSTTGLNQFYSNLSRNNNNEIGNLKNYNSRIMGKTKTNRDCHHLKAQI